MPLTDIDSPSLPMQLDYEKFVKKTLDKAEAAEK